MLHLIPQIPPVIQSAIILFIGYIDIGKWAAAIEGGSCFGLDFLLLLFCFHCIAILCQYFANCIGLVTGKNLAQICREEYSRETCIALGVVTELSMTASDLTKILGVAHGIVVLFELDMLRSIVCAAVIGAIVPFFFVPMGPYKIKVLLISLSSFTLLFYVLGVLLSQPEASSIIRGGYSGLNLETACTIMALLGSQIMPYNFYIHSSLVQQHRGQQYVSRGAMIHKYLFAIVSGFTGIFLVNYVIMSSAASAFSSYGLVPTLQDAFLLMDQIFRSAASPFPFSIIFLFSSLVTASTFSQGGKIILHDFFLVNLPIWAHHTIARVLTVIPALYLISSAGSEGIYQLLLFCQVISAVLLPPSVIPLFRVISSRSIMGAFKISSLVEFLVLIAFMGILTANIIFTTELLFGNCRCIGKIQGTKGFGEMFYAILLLLVLSSLIFTLYLLLMPLKSSEGPASETHTSQYDEENDPVRILYDGDQKFTIITPDQCNDFFLESYSTESKTAVGSEQDAGNFHLAQTPATTYIPRTVKSVVDRVFAGGSGDTSFLASNEPIDSIHKNVGLEMDVLPDDDQMFGSSEILEFSTTSAFRLCASAKAMETGENASVDSGNEAHSFGLSRGEKQKLAAFLDEFWGLFFDYHGKLTKEAKVMSVQNLLGLGFELPPLPANAETPGRESHLESSLDAQVCPVYPTTCTGCNSSPMLRGVPSAISPYVGPMTTMQSWDQQPTGHGFELASRSFMGSSLPRNGDPFMSTLDQNGFGLPCRAGSQEPEASESRCDLSFYTSNSSWCYARENNSIASNSLSSNNESDQWGDPFGYRSIQCPNLDPSINEASLRLDISGSNHSEDNNSQPMHVTMGHDAVWDNINLHGEGPPLTWGGKRVTSRSGGSMTRLSGLSYVKSEHLVLQSLKLCIRELLSLEGSESLFGQNGGRDEGIIDLFAATLRLLPKDDPWEAKSAQSSKEGGKIVFLPVLPYCGKGCIWQASLIVSFGVWCVHRILDLLLTEKRPDLWGKYTFILNRLQGILDPAFRKPRKPFVLCKCLPGPLQEHIKENPGGAECTSPSSILALIKDVETSISRCKGERGTAARKIAYSKGKKNLTSVLKRYICRLSELPCEHVPSYEKNFDHSNCCARCERPE